jgi:hypothetical protein
MAVSMLAACALSASPLHAQSNSSGPAPQLTKEQQEIFDREEKLPALMHQQAISIVDQAIADLGKLRDRLEPELVKQEISGPPSPDSSARPSDNGGESCTMPGQPPTMLTDIAGLDQWFKLEADGFARLKAMLDERYDLWLKIKPQTQQNIRDDNRRPYVADPRYTDATRPTSPLVAATRALLGSENTYYRDEYQIAAVALTILWDAEQDELSGSTFLNHRELVGLAGLMNDEAKRKMDTYHDTLWNLDSCSGAYLRAGNEAAARRIDTQRSATYQECLSARESLRDEFAKRFRDVRDRLVAEGLDIRTRLSDWRAFAIANHFYVGEGEAAISTEYGEPVPKHIGAIDTWIGYMASITQIEMWKEDFLTKPGGASPDATTSIDAGACGSMNDDDQQQLMKVIKYPDVETEPYRFAVIFDAPSVLDMVVSGAAKTERP